MAIYLRARVIEGVDQWYDRLELEGGASEVRLVNNDELAIQAPCDQNGFNSLYNVGKLLWDQDLCSKFEIAAFESKELFWIYRPDQWNFEENHFSSDFNDALLKHFASYCEKGDQSLADYQDRFWEKRHFLVDPEAFKSIVDETLLQEDLKNVRAWVERSGDIPDDVGFVHQGMRIVNPFYDETLRFAVEPVSYYGLKNVKGFVEQVKSHLSVPVVENKEPLDAQIFEAAAIKKPLPSNNVDRRETREREN